MRKTNILKYTVILIVLVTLVACGGGEKTPSTTNVTAPQTKIDPLKIKGVGPVKDLVLPEEIDAEMVAKGKEIFDTKCSVCHKIDKKFIGPSPKGIIERRHPAWIMNMILNPQEMVKKDPIAKDLLMEYNGSPMVGQGVTEEGARAILEYFRTLE